MRNLQAARKKSKQSKGSSDSKARAWYCLFLLPYNCQPCEPRSPAAQLRELPSAPLTITQQTPRAALKPHPTIPLPKSSSPCRPKGESRKHQTVSLPFAFPSLAQSVPHARPPRISRLPPTRAPSRPPSSSQVANSSLPILPHSQQSNPTNHHHLQHEYRNTTPFNHNHNRNHIHRRGRYNPHPAANNPRPLRSPPRPLPPLRHPPPPAARRPPVRPRPARTVRLARRAHRVPPRETSRSFFFLFLLGLHRIRWWDSTSCCAPRVRRGSQDRQGGVEGR